MIYGLAGPFPSNVLICIGAFGHISHIDYGPRPVQNSCGPELPRLPILLCLSVFRFSHKSFADILTLVAMLPVVLSTNTGTTSIVPRLMSKDLLEHFPISKFLRTIFMFHKCCKFSLFN